MYYSEAVFLISKWSLINAGVISLGSVLLMNILTPHGGSLLQQLCVKCLAQGLLSGRCSPCVCHAVSQPAFPTEFSQSVCAERRDGVMSRLRGMMDEPLTAQGSADVCLNHPANGELAQVQRSFLNPWLNPYMRGKAIAGIALVENPKQVICSIHHYVLISVAGVSLLLIISMHTLNQPW